jgi:hypothetical protein
VPRRPDFVRFRVGDEELEVAFVLALELAYRAAESVRGFLDSLQGFHAELVETEDGATK